MTGVVVSSAKIDRGFVTYSNLAKEQPRACLVAAWQRMGGRSARAMPEICDNYGHGRNEGIVHQRPCKV